MNAAIITIGDELLIGQVTDTNSSWLASELTALGFSVHNIVSISDEGTRIKAALDYYLPNHDLLIITGGLGPTNDDITKKVLTDYFNTRLVVSEIVLAHVEKIITGFGAVMNDKNCEQALVPEAAQILFNNHGTAPGMWFEKDEKVVISLPGVPSEMKGIFADHIKTALRERFSLPDLVYRTLMFTGIGESDLAMRLSDWEAGLDDIKVAYLPSPGTIRLRLGAEGRNDADSRLEKEIRSLHEIAPEYLFSDKAETLEEVVGRLIFERRGFLAVAESCTGGSVAGRITAIPGCSAWFRGGAVAYSNEIKSGILGVDPAVIAEHGAVSEETVRQMANGVKRVFNADYAIATSGVAGPTGGTAEKPVGTVWIAASGPDFLEAKKFIFGKNRRMNILRSSSAAFNLLRKEILKREKP